MATITGLKLSELSTLALGSTGTLFYAASAASNSYKMYEKDLYNTINRLHISGDYQPKIEDWRFVHKTGNERITGEKTFVNNMILTNTSSLQVEDLIIDSYGNLVSNLNDNFISLQSGTIGQYFASPEVSIHINNRALSGNWSAQKFSPTGIYGKTDSSKYIDFNNYGLSGGWSVENLHSNKSISGNLVSGNRLVSRVIHSSGLYSRLITGKVAYIDEFYLNEDAEHTFHNDITFDNVGLGQQTAIFGIDGSVEINRGIGFWGSGTPQAQPVITGSRGGNVALASLLTGLHYMGIIDNRTTV